MLPPGSPPLSLPPTIARDPRDDAAWADVRDAWELEPGCVYLNHGSFGPAPRPVREAHRAWQDALQRNPMQFLARNYEPLLDEATGRVASYVGCGKDDLALVENSTVAMNIVAASMRLSLGDEVLLTDHEYGAFVRIWQRACEASGARLTTATLPNPITSADDVVAAVARAITPRTRLLVFSHVTSPTAVVLPAAALCRLAQENDVAVCVDGPHAIAARPLDIAALDCDFYTASCHKWLSAPTGSGFLYAHPRQQAEVRPLVVSWGRWPAADTPRWRDEFMWLGTRDPAALLSVPTAMDFLAAVGLDSFRERTHALAAGAKRQIEQLTGLPALLPDSLEWYGPMIALPLPAGLKNAFATQREATDWFHDRHGIEALVTQWREQYFLRVSCHLYTTAAHLARLYEAASDVLRLAQ